MNNKPCRVLVVEDDHPFADTLAEILDMYGYNTTVCYDGIRGRDVLARIQPDVAVLDLGLPGLDGFGVARAARAELGQGVLLIALTGLVEREHEARAYESGFNHFVRKPSDPQIVLSMIHDWLAKA